ncbi:MAG: Formamidopyrimidine-DNA glycosylase [Bacilli bacterium]|nr:Formamidopyrimidine-DNA glycosylase [Bacilli bacterium]
MPELPEVETVRRSLEALIAWKTIEDVQVMLPRIVRTPSDVSEFAFLLQGCTISAVKRRGKFLLFSVDPYVLVSHLRMEGRYGLYSKEDPIEKHTHLIFRFTDKTELRYRDVRQFGTFDLLTPETLNRIDSLRTMGPEPLESAFTVETLWLALQKRKQNCKAALLDQSFVAGLGNIYVDEALFAAGIHPATKCSAISYDQCARLHQAIRAVLLQALQAGGSSIKSYVNGYGSAGDFQFQLRVYGRTGQPCTVCGTPISKIRVAGRGTHFCSNCQPAPEKEN